MGWFWDRDNAVKKDDAVKNLDPSLKEFLEKQKPVDYVPGRPTPEPSVRPSPVQEPLDQTAPQKPIVPAESLFPDGRYADLWKNYKPLSVVESQGKTDVEKLSDLVDGFKSREDELNRASQENCSFEWLAQQDCIKNGGWMKRMTMCRAEMGALSRCMTMQGKTMKAMGFVNPDGRTQDRQDTIQVRADDLYRTMLEQEAAIEKAKEEGTPVPTFESLSAGIAKGRVGKSAFGPMKTGDLTEEELKPLNKDVREAFKNRLQDLTGFERELEVEALRAEIQASQHLGLDYRRIAEEESMRRHARKEAGKETLGDRIKSLWGGWK